MRTSSVLSDNRLVRVHLTKAAERDRTEERTAFADSCTITCVLRREDQERLVLWSAFLHIETLLAPSLGSAAVLVYALANLAKVRLDYWWTGYRVTVFDLRLELIREILEEK